LESNFLDGFPSCYESFNAEAEQVRDVFRGTNRTCRRN